jgi:cholesterol transport system auxiliary component
MIMQERKQAIRRIVGAAMIAALGVTLAACVEFPVGKDAPPRLYVLTPKSTYPDSIPNADWQLLVETPVSPAGLNTARIALQDSPIELRYFEFANWIDYAPKMVQALIIESFENSAKIVSVGREQIGLRSDFVLKTELREFQAEYEDRLPADTKELGPNAPAPWVRVRLNAKLVKMPQREIVAHQTFERRVRAQENRMNAIIDAFDDALGKTLKSVVVWTLETGDREQVNARASRP